MAIYAMVFFRKWQMADNVASFDATSPRPSLTTNAYPNKPPTFLTTNRKKAHK